MSDLLTISQRGTLMKVTTQKRSEIRYDVIANGEIIGIVTARGVKWVSMIPSITKAGKFHSIATSRYFDDAVEIVAIATENA